MIAENEIIMLFLGAGLFIFILIHRLRLQEYQAFKILLAGYCLLLAGCFFTVLEGFFLEDLLNYMEHICYAGSSLLVTVWCMKVFGSKKGG